MSAHAHQSTHITVPNDLETARAKLVYLYVTARGGATIDDVCRTLDLTKGTALTITKALRDRGHLELHDGHYVPT